MEPTRRNSRSNRPPKPPPERKPVSSNGGNSNVSLFIVAAVVCAVLAALVFTGNSQTKIKFGQFRELLENKAKLREENVFLRESKMPLKDVADAHVDVKEPINGHEATIRYSNLRDLQVGPNEIAGTVTRKILAPPEVAGRGKGRGLHLLTLRPGPGQRPAFGAAWNTAGSTTTRAALPSPWRSYLLMLALIGVAIVAMVILVRRLGGTSSAMAFGRSRGKLLAQEDIGVTFDEVAGIDEAVDELREVVDFLKQPEKYQVLGGRIPKGVLLVGPPGTGKTLLGKAVAGEAGVPFFSLSGSDFVEMFVGVGAARVRDMFQQAVAKAPCIVFIDEFDALGKTRGTSIVGGHDEREQTLNALLVEMDGVNANSGVIVMAATNRPETLDPALLRPGASTATCWSIGPTSADAKRSSRSTSATSASTNRWIVGEVARITSGFVGADLANLVNEAALLAARAGRSAVTMDEFTEGVERVTAGLEKRQRIMHADEKQRVAYHESAHALVAASLPNTDPVHKVSIIPRGLAALGYVMQRPEGDRYLLTQGELESRIQVALAGTLAEEMVFGDVSTGAQNDLERATEIARSMVMDYGMSRLGRATYRESRRNVFLATQSELPGDRTHSEHTAREIDEEINHILEGGPGQGAATSCRRGVRRWRPWPSG